MQITIVGVCASGKSELARRLREQGWDARTVAQEHSHVPQLWRHDGEPDVLVYLSASLREVLRRGRIGMTAGELREQRRRLAHARRHASIRVRTDGQTPEAVSGAVGAHLAERYTGRTTQQRGGAS